MAQPQAQHQRFPCCGGEPRPRRNSDVSRSAGGQSPALNPPGGETITSAGRHTLGIALEKRQGFIVGQITLAGDLLLKPRDPRRAPPIDRRVPQGRIAVARTSVLDYRRPSAAVDASKSSLNAAVRRRERAYQWAGWIMLGCGALALLLAPAIVTAIFAKVQTQFARHEFLAGASAFAIAAALLIPPLFWFERLTRGQWFEPDVHGDAVARIPVAGITEIV